MEMERAGKTFKVIWHSIEFPAYFWVSVLKKNEAATISGLNFRGKIIFVQSFVADEWELPQN